MQAREVITAKGHKNILATNRNTVEITRESHLSKRGDCIIAVASNKGVGDLSVATHPHLASGPEDLISLSHDDIFGVRNLIAGRANAGCELSFIRDNEQAISVPERAQRRMRAFGVPTVRNSALGAHRRAPRRGSAGLPGGSRNMVVRVRAALANAGPVISAGQPTVE